MTDVRSASRRSRPSAPWTSRVRLAVVRIQLAALLLWGPDGALARTLGRHEPHERNRSTRTLTSSDGDTFLTTYSTEPTPVTERGLEDFGLHPVNCPEGSLLNNWRVVFSGSTISSSTTSGGSQQQGGQTIRLEYTCLRVPATAAQCSRATDNYYLSGPASNLRFCNELVQYLVESKDPDKNKGDQAIGEAR
ncbi:hypothetical protein HYH03_018635 [Edaphochlamys debaryana]|uniref:Uncharacterized protein n=1 Tax=Edaphochlamys debaryana TaxID=47281 RepID=A0A835XEW8_9CHLO|nr:hypothetical protein HYH03_018635 [Edaphochlamys debaryana]|eukprot:KAG2482431.1 hypothetical protein HYH03_018635 [Edaphochlamys debaryana]